MVYSEQMQIRWHETDQNRAMRPSALLALLQELANHQLHAAGMDLDELRDRKQVGFLLSRIAVSCPAPLHAYEKVETQTWTCPGHGLNFERCFGVLRGSEQVVCAWSSWGLMDLQQRRLLRVEEMEYPVTPEQKILPSGIPARFRMPPISEMELAGTRTIRYSDIDYNGHMNNTKYPDMLVDFLPDPAGVWVSGFSLSFLQEAKLGSTLALYRASWQGEGDPGFLFRAVDAAGNTCLEALLTVRPV